MPQAWIGVPASSAGFIHDLKKTRSPLPVAAPLISAGWSACLSSGGVGWDRRPEGDSVYLNNVS